MTARAWWCRECEAYVLVASVRLSGDKFCVRCATRCELVPDARVPEAKVTELKAELRAKDACWHCKVCLLPTKPRCETCPDECDDEGCSGEACRESREKEGKDG